MQVLLLGPEQSRVKTALAVRLGGVQIQRPRHIRYDPLLLQLPEHVGLGEVLILPGLGDEVLDLLPHAQLVQLRYHLLSQDFQSFLFHLGNLLLGFELGFPRGGPVVCRGG